jgi:hypothetical protein
MRMLTLIQTVKKPHNGSLRVVVITKITSAFLTKRVFAEVGSLLTLPRVWARSPELRHQLVVFLSDLMPESASERKNAASFLVYLYWAFLGVTLAKEQMVRTVWITRPRLTQ